MSLMRNLTEPNILKLLAYISIGIILLLVILFTSFEVGNYGGIFK